MMPRDAATEGAETTLMSAREGRRRPAIAGRSQGLESSGSATAPSYVIVTLEIGASVSWPAKRSQALRQRDERLQTRRLFGRDGRKIDRVRNCAARQIVRHLLGDLQGDILLGFRRQAPRCGVAITLGCPNRGLIVAGSSVNTSKAAPATWP